MIADTLDLHDPTSIAEEGERIYAEHYRAKFERCYDGQFVAIDLGSEDAFVAPHAEEAVEKAVNKHGDCTVHLVRVGEATAYQMSFFLPTDATLVRPL